MNRQQRAAIAQETLAILQLGAYQLPDGHNVSIRDALDRACQATMLYQPDDYPQLLEQIAAAPHDREVTIQVSNRTRGVPAGFWMIRISLPCAQQHDTFHACISFFAPPGEKRYANEDKVPLCRRLNT
jgi:hypothetical protein